MQYVLRLFDLPFLLETFYRRISEQTKSTNADDDKKEIQKIIMNFLLYITILIMIFVFALRFVGYKVGYLLPVLAGFVIIIAIVRVILIRRKNKY